MRTFVIFLFTSYLLALLLVCRVSSVYWLALSHGLLEPRKLWQILLIIGSLLATIPLFRMMMANDTVFHKRWLSFFFCVTCLFTSIVTLSSPITEFPEGVLLGIIGMFGILWLAVGSVMVHRYCFLIQRGWTEKEKVSRKRAQRRRRRYTIQEPEEDDDPMTRKLTCKQRLNFLGKFVCFRRPKSIFV